MVLVVDFAALPRVSIGGRGAGLEIGGVFHGPRVGVTSSQLDGHESTHLGASEVG